VDGSVSACPSLIQNSRPDTRTDYHCVLVSLISIFPASPVSRLGRSPLREAEGSHGLIKTGAFPACAKPRLPKYLYGGQALRRRQAQSTLRNQQRHRVFLFSVSPHLAIIDISVNVECKPLIISAMLSKSRVSIVSVSWW